jgi:glutamate synthase domain-containing protein 3
MLGGQIARRYGSAGLPEETIRFHFKGSAGQSFAAFLPRGVTLTLEGEANDYVGKGLSGGRVIIFPPKNSGFLPEESILAGNVVLYGATSGEVFLNGVAGERFAVRNSGATAVVEGVGDHGCEYMTNGLVIVLGACGRNFAAGMSGGLAYVLDDSGDFARTQCNRASVDLDPLQDSEDAAKVRELIERHRDLTGSPRAAWILENWDAAVAKFLKVYPHELKRVRNEMLAKETSEVSKQLPGVLVSAAAGAEQVRHG